MTFDLAALKRQARQRDLARVQAAKDSLALRPSTAPAPQAQRSPARWLEVTLGAALDGPHATRDHDQAWQLLARCQTPCAHYQGDSCALKGPPDCLTRRRREFLDYLTLEGPDCDQFRPRPKPLPRVGIITPSLLLGGAERWVASLLMHLDRSQLDLSGVLSLQPGDQQIEDQVRRAAPLYVGPEHATGFADQCDIIVAWGTRHLRMFPRGRVPVVFVSHGFGQWTTDAVNGSRDRVTHWAAVSRWAVQSFPQDIRPLARVIHNGIDVDHCRTTRARDHVRQSWGLDPGDIAVGYIGRMSWEKHPVAAAIAAAHLGPPFRPVYVGDGHKLGDVRAVVEQVHPRALFVPPVYPVGDALQAVDVFVLASPSEGFSLGLAEAWFSGVPTVATPVGAIPELAEQFGPLAVTVPVNPRPVELADAILYATSRDNRATVEYARQVTRDHFTAPAMGRAWTNYLLEILDQQ